MVTSLCSCSLRWCICTAMQSDECHQFVTWGRSQRCTFIFKCLRGIFFFFFLHVFWLDVKSHVTSLTYFCIFVTRLHLLSSNNKSIADEGLLFIRAETLETLEKSWRLKGSRNTEPFIFTESHVSNWDPPLWFWTFVRRRRLKKWPGRPYLTLSLHLPFPLKTTTWCSDKKAF